MSRRAILVLGATVLLGCSLLLGCILLLWTPALVREVGLVSEGGRTGVVVVGGADGECTMPPDTFQETDLLGTWSAGNDLQKDTLILEDGGFYRQLLEIERPPFSYESDPQRWRVEYRDGSPPLLHLEGMRLCVYSLSSNCPPPPQQDHWYDYCSDAIVEAHGEGVLLVVGVPSRFEQPPRGIELAPLVKDPDSGGWPYLLQP